MDHSIASAAHKPRVLVVTHEEVAARSIESQLVGLGYEPAGHATHGADAVALAAELKPDLVLMDIGLAGCQDGIDTATAIRTRTSLPVVFLTASANDATLTRAKFAEPFGFIHNPFTAQELRVVIEMTLYKHQVETKLRKSEERLRMVLLGSRDGIWDRDLVTSEVYYSPRWFDILGYGANELPLSAELWTSLMHPDDVQGARQQVADMHAGDATNYELVVRLRHKAGHYVPVLSRGFVVRDAGGKALRAVGTSTDLTSRRKADAQRRESDQRFRTIFEAEPECVKVLGPTGDLLEMNEAGLAMLEAASVNEAKAHGLINFVLPAYRADFTALHQRVMAGSNELLEFEVAGLRGTHRWLETHAAPMRNAEGKVTMLLGITRDITARKRGEEALRKSEEQLRLVMRGGDLGLWDVDLVSGGLAVNGRWMSMIGLDPAGPMPTMAEWRSLIHPDDLPTVDQAFEGIGHDWSKSEFEAEIRARHADGRFVWILKKGAVVERATDGRPLRVSGTHMDVSARKRAEAAMVESERILSNLFANLPGMAYRCINDADWTMKIVSEGCKVVTGYDRDELQQNRSVAYGDLIHPDDREQLWKKCQASLDAHTPCTNEYRIITKSGEIRWVSERAAGIYSEDGALLSIEGFVQDITTRKQAEEATREVEQRLRTLIEWSPEAVVVHRNKTIIYVNPSAIAMYGATSAQDLVGKSTIDFVHPDYRDTVLERLSSINGDRSTLPLIEVKNLKLDGTPFDVEVQSVAIVFEGEPAIHVSARDISARKRAEASRELLEAQLRESQKMQAIGTLAGGIAHDFNNILATILGNAELARQDVTNNPLALESLQEIHKAGSRARDLVQQILSFSRRQPTERKPIALLPVVNESVRLLRAMLPPRVALDVHVEGIVPTVLADATQIEQLVINLATNAMQAMAGSPGRVEIRLDTVMPDAALANTQRSLSDYFRAHPGRTARITVIDNGPGMDAATLARIFEPFFTTKPVDEGTGLGLSVVHGIVQAHEGAITVESEPGKGATFTLYLPATDEMPSNMTAAEVSAAVTPRTPMPATGPHILYLDDDESLVFLVTRLLERRGYRVSGHTEQQEALAALRADPGGYDLVVTDYNMPGMSGLDVARAVRTIRTDLPVAVASGFIDEALRAQAEGSGVRELIFKASAANDFCDALVRLTSTTKTASAQ